MKFRVNLPTVSYGPVKIGQVRVITYLGNKIEPHALIVSENPKYSNRCWFVKILTKLLEIEKAIGFPDEKRLYSFGERWIKDLKTKYI